MWPCLAISLCLLPPHPAHRYVTLGGWHQNPQPSSAVNMQKRHLKRNIESKAGLAYPSMNCLYNQWRSAICIPKGCCCLHCHYCHVNKSTGYFLKKQFNLKYYSSLLTPKSNCVTVMEKIKHTIRFKFLLLWGEKRCPAIGWRPILGAARLSPRQLEQAPAEPCDPKWITRYRWLMDGLGLDRTKKLFSLPPMFWHPLSPSSECCRHTAGVFGRSWHDGLISWVCHSKITTLKRITKTQPESVGHDKCNPSLLHNLIYRGIDRKWERIEKQAEITVLLMHQPPRSASFVSCLTFHTSLYMHSCASANGCRRKAWATTLGHLNNSHAA